MRKKSNGKTQSNSNQGAAMRSLLLSVVSKIRAATQSLPKVQKCLLERTEKDMSWVIATYQEYRNLENTSAVYLMFSGSRLLYIGQTKHLRTRTGEHSVFMNMNKGNQMVYILLPLSTVTDRKTIENCLSKSLRPKFGYIVHANAFYGKCWDGTVIQRENYI